jgi:hypothetical protein
VSSILLYRAYGTGGIDRSGSNSALEFLVRHIESIARDRSWTFDGHKRPGRAR